MFLATECFFPCLFEPYRTRRSTAHHQSDVTRSKSRSSSTCGMPTPDLGFWVLLESPNSFLSFPLTRQIQFLGNLCQQGKCTPSTLMLPLVKHARSEDQTLLRNSALNRRALVYRIWTMPLYQGARGQGTNSCGMVMKSLNGMLVFSTFVPSPQNNRLPCLLMY